MLHSVLIAQSSTLAIMLRAATHETRIKSLKVKTSSAFTNIAAISAALHSCYGEPITEIFSMVLNSGVSKATATWPDTFGNAMAFYMAGQLLGLRDPILISHGYILQMLSFEDLERTLAMVFDTF